MVTYIVSDSTVGSYLLRQDEKLLQGRKGLPQLVLCYPKIHSNYTKQMVK
jgi:hypothetical protein